MKSKEFYRKIILNRYDEIFTIWYADYSNIPKSEIILEINGVGDSGYSDKGNKIIFRIPDGNLEDFHKKNFSLYPYLWETELLHEMLHEYQFKILTKPSLEGVQLFNKYQVNESTPKHFNNVSGFSGNGHNELFYTAIDRFYIEYTNNVEEFILHYI